MNKKIPCIVMTSMLLIAGCGGGDTAVDTAVDTPISPSETRALNSACMNKGKAISLAPRTKGRGWTDSFIVLCSNGEFVAIDIGEHR